jgi:hypothetical protein
MQLRLEASGEAAEKAPPDKMWNCKAARLRKWLRKRTGK